MVKEKKKGIKKEKKWLNIVKRRKDIWPKDKGKEMRN
jgi:hypothetical protein